MRYLGKCHGYYPKDPVMAAKVDFVVENYLGVFYDLNAPGFAAEEAKAALIDNIFDKILPEMMTKMTPNLKMDKKFLFGDSLTIADFWIGGLYVNLINNPAVGFAPEKWAKAKVDYPEFTAYGERFTKEMGEYLTTRGARPF